MTKFSVDPKKGENSHLFSFSIYLYKKNQNMKNKIVLTEEESKRILSLHKKRIQKERNLINEGGTYKDPGQSTGRIMAGSGGGAGTGALIGLMAGGPAGAALGAVIGAGVGALTGWMTTGGGYADRVRKAFVFCRNNRQYMGKPVNSIETLRGIADNFHSATSGFGNTNLRLIQNNLRMLKTIPDLCKVSAIYQQRFNETLFENFDGDIDVDNDWRDYVWIPISELAKNTKKIPDEKLKENAKACGWGNDVDGYRNSGWRCPKDKSKNEKEEKARRCGHASWEDYKNSGWKCNNVVPDPDPDPDPNPRPRRGQRYYFNYQDALNALKNKKCSSGSGGEEGGDEDTFADDWKTTTDKKVDTTVTTDNFSNWSK